jgi:carbonic anhydrase
MSTCRLPIAALTVATLLLCSGGATHALGADAHASTPKHVPSPASAPTKPAHASDHSRESTGAKPIAQPAADDAHDAHAEHRPAMKKPAARKVEPEPAGPATAESALKMLTEGNARWVAGQTTAPNTDTARRSALAENGQKPFVTVLTCADSRLPVERVFDRGIGDVFVVRVAGNVAGGSETGTIEYGVEHLKTPLLVVMGHTRCGAVAAAASGAQLHGRLGELVAEIAPAVERAKRSNPGADEKTLTDLAIRENVWQQIFTLIKHSGEVRSALGKGDLKVVGAVCDIATGKVEFLGEHPWQNELVDAMNAREQKRQTAEAGHGE